MEFSGILLQTGKEVRLDVPQKFWMKIPAKKKKNYLTFNKNFWAFQQNT